MNAPAGAIVACDFDTQALGLPAFRIVDNEADWASALGTLPTPSFCDAKVAADRGDERPALERAGFRHVATLLTFEAEARSADASDVAIAPSLRLTDAEHAAHAANFTHARHLVDPLLPRAGARRLMRRWIENSLRGRREVAHLGSDFTTFAATEDAVTIDLVSVLQTRRGHAKRLIAAVASEAARRRLPTVRVTTEAANLAAIRTYLGCGMAPVRATFAMHRVA